MWEVESLRCAAVFGRSHEMITLSEGGALATKDVHGGFHTAASRAVMRAGRHYAQFTAVRGMYTFFGVIRPGWEVEGGKQAHNVDGDDGGLVGCGCEEVGGVARGAASGGGHLQPCGVRK
jgi:hypothetical protein